MEYNYSIHMKNNIIWNFKCSDEPKRFLPDLVSKQFFLVPNCNIMINTQEIIYVDWKEV